MSTRLLRALRPLPLVALLGPIPLLAASPGAPPTPAPATSAPLAATAPISAERAQRLPDGRVFLPKSAQRRLALRTLPAREQTVPRRLELLAEVVADPRSSGQVQATQAGRIDAPAAGLPLPGQRVQRGQVLALLEPVLPAAERAQREAELAELVLRAGLVERQLARAKELAATVPRREAEALQAELDGLRQRREALVQGARAEALRAPVAGVVARVAAGAGQVVAAGTLLFEIVEPSRLLIEARVADARLAAGLQGAELADGSATPLVVVGRAVALRDGLLPLLLRPQPRAGEAAPVLALHQPVRVLAQTGERLTGFVLPAAALVRNAANEPAVWRHERAELFAPVPVQVQPLDGRHVVVTGLAEGDRVVTQGAALLAQVR
jgi:multidrug efflux pump subunit AcrA (membrane-fusion protein)